MNLTGNTTGEIWSYVYNSTTDLQTTYHLLIHLQSLALGFVLGVAFMVAFIYLKEWQFRNKTERSNDGN